MDTESQKRLAAIVALEPAAMTEDDGAFLRARSSYLTEDQRVKFAAVLEVETIQHEITQQDLDANPGLEKDVTVGHIVELPANAKPLEEMTKTELTEIAKPLGIEVGAFESKASVIERINAATAAPQQ